MFTICVTLECAIYFNPYSQMGFRILHALNKTVMKMRLSSIPSVRIPAGKASTEKYTYKYRWPSPPVPTVIVRKHLLKHDNIKTITGELGGLMVLENHVDRQKLCLQHQALGLTT